jgi:outer membrane translocation and assembly module TamA
VPGLGSEPHFVHVLVAGGVDTRPSGNISRRGSQLNAAIHRYADTSPTAFSFSQFVLEGEQLVPVAHERGALSFAGNLWMSAGANVPFFLMPTLGGGDYLRGYPTYRFRDRDAVVVTAQFQWAVHKYVDGVAFVDAGTVAPQLSAIRLSAVPVTQGIGVRVHTPIQTIFRLDVARSVEGFQLLIGFTSRASAVF